MAKMVIIPEAVFQKIGGYLLSRPYGEVKQLIPELEQTAKIIEVPGEDKKEGEVVVDAAQEG